jgi:hypothetical protein
MHLLFYGKEQIKLLKNHTVEYILQEQTVKVFCLFLNFAFLNQLNNSKGKHTTVLNPSNPYRPSSRRTRYQRKS